MPKKAEVLSNIPLPNITEHKQAEEAIRESEEKYRTIFENVNDQIVYLDKYGNIIDVNNRVENIFGYKREEVLGRNFTKLGIFSVKNLPKMVTLFGKLSRGKAIDMMEVEIKRKDGGAALIETSTRLVKKDGKVQGILVIIRDITERKQAEEALRESEEKYRSLFKNMLNGFAHCQILVDENNKPIDFVYLEVNGAFERLTGLRKEDVVGRKVTEAIPGIKEAHPELFSIYGKVALTGKPAQFDVYFEPLEIWLSISVYSPQKGYFVAIFENITERKQAEEALRKSEEHFRSVTESASDAIISTDSHGNIVYWNNTAETIFSYSADEVIGKPLTVIMPERFRQAHQEAMNRVVPGGSPNIIGKTAEVVGLRKNGSEFPLELSLSSWRTREGIFFTGIARDITERKRAEEALRESEERYRALINLGGTVGEAIVMLQDRDGIDATHTFVSDEWPHITGHSREELLGVSFYDLLHPRYREASLKRHKRKISGEAIPEFFEMSIIRKDGTEVPIELTSAYTTYKGELANVAFIRDITERKRIEQELQKKNEQLDAQNEELQLQGEELMAQQQELIEKSQEVEKATQAKSAFLATMSHELRTPLNAVIGFSQLLLDGIPGKVNKEQGQCLNDILSSGEHLLNLINDVLDLSKVEAGKIELKPENLNLADVIDSVVHTVKPMLEDNSHLLEFCIEEKLPQVRADEDRLRQILLNLMSNAIKFTPPGGKLGIEISRDGDWCRVSIVDNGIGIKKEDQKRIFEPFTQAGSLPKKRMEGTGLGLALTKQFVEMYGGKIWVESKYRKGSKFTFTLPLATAA